MLSSQANFRHSGGPGLNILMHPGIRSTNRQHVCYPAVAHCHTGSWAISFRTPTSPDSGSNLGTLVQRAVLAWACGAFPGLSALKSWLRHAGMLSLLGPALEGNQSSGSGIPICLPDINDGFSQHERHGRQPCAHPLSAVLSTVDPLSGRAGRMSAVQVRDPVLGVRGPPHQPVPQGLQGQQRPVPSLRERLPGLRQPKPRRGARAREGAPRALAGVLGGVPRGVRRAPPARQQAWLRRRCAGVCGLRARGGPPVS